MYVEEALEALEALGGWSTSREVADYLETDSTEASQALGRAWDKDYVDRQDAYNDWNQPCYEWRLTRRGRLFLELQRE